MCASPSCPLATALLPLPLPPPPSPVQLLDHPAVHDIFPSDVITRARALLADIPGGLGAYSESPGAMCIRRMVADAISRRDGGIPCDPEGIYMTDGASPGVHYIMEMLIRSPKDAFMVPIPQYPLYSATLTLYGGTLVPYELDEATGWSLDVAQMAAALAAAREKGLLVRGLVVINPGNPTGQCLSRQNMVRACALVALRCVACARARVGCACCACSLPAACTRLRRPLPTSPAPACCSCASLSGARVPAPHAHKPFARLPST